MFALAASLSGPLPKAGVVVVAALAALVLLDRRPRARAMAMLGALVLSPVLLASAIWNSPQLRVAHRHPLWVVVGLVIAIAVLGVLARWLAPRLRLLAPLAVFAMPFRVPIESGSTTNNLLVPLYLVVAVGALAWLVPVLREDPPPPERPDGSGGWAVWVDRLLAVSIVLYALQAIYSLEFQKALQQMVFFYVPFALLYRLLRDLRWSSDLVRACLRVLIGLALIFSVIGFVEYATKSIFLNTKLVVDNDLHTYFTINSVFLDPDIFGRFLALTIILLAVLLIYDRSARDQLLVVGTLAVLWACLVLTLSRSSLGALLVGMAVLAALRWKPSRALVIAVVVILIGAAAVAATPTTFGLNQGINNASSGRGGLVGTGLTMFGDRPIWGYGAASFATEYHRHHPRQALADSHTIPVTIAAEQGLIGLLVYVPLLVCALICLLRHSRGDPVRAAVGAAFAALVFHTILYADFLEDPFTWALLGIGVALAIDRRTGPAPAQPGEPAANAAA